MAYSLKIRRIAMRRYKLENKKVNDRIQNIIYLRILKLLSNISYL